MVWLLFIGVIFCFLSIFNNLICKFVGVDFILFKNIVLFLVNLNLFWWDCVVLVYVLLVVLKSLFLMSCLGIVL